MQRSWLQKARLLIFYVNNVLFNFPSSRPKELPLKKEGAKIKPFTMKFLLKLPEVFKVT